MALPFTTNKDGVRLAVRVTPNAGQNKVSTAPAADGQPRLAIRVTAPPENGKANKAVIKVIAKNLKLPASSIALTAGAKDRNKVLLISGDSADIVARLSAWIEELP